MTIETIEYAEYHVEQRTRHVIMRKTPNGGGDPICMGEFDSEERARETARHLAATEANAAAIDGAGKPWPAIILPIVVKP